LPPRNDVTAFNLQPSTFNLHPSTSFEFEVYYEIASPAQTIINLVSFSLPPRNDVTAFNLQLSTFNLQPSTFNLHPSTSFEFEMYYEIASSAQTIINLVSFSLPPRNERPHSTFNLQLSTFNFQLSTNE
jgi:hypothetical protein